MGNIDNNVLMDESNTKVCVTGGSGYIGSSLVKKLLEKGYMVHATLRNLEDKSKVELLKSFPKADTNLVLLQADICNPSEFEHAIEGCEFVFHVATPMEHDPKKSQGKDRIEVTVDGVKSIADACLRSPTVKRLVYTASVMALSPLSDDGKIFKPAIDESCWTPLHLSFPNCNDYTLEYLKAKTLAEKAILSYNERNGSSKLEVVTLACGLVGGQTLLPYPPLSVEVIYSQLASNLFGYKHGLRFMEDLLDSIPLVHVDDVCEAHIFSIEHPSMNGRFLCAATNPTSREMAMYFTKRHPKFHINEGFMGEPGSGTICDSSKLRRMGFEYKYGLQETMDESLKCGQRLGAFGC